MNELKRNLRKFSARDKKPELKKELEQEEEMLEKLKDTLQQKKAKEEEKKDILDALEEKSSVSAKLDEIREQMERLKEELASAQEQLKQVLQMTGMYPSEKEQRAAEIREEIFRTDIERLKGEIAELKDKHGIQLLALEFVFEGMSINNAQQAAIKEQNSSKAFYSSTELA